MGWDAHSSATQNWKSRSKKQLALKEAFKKAHSFVVAKVGQVDGYLQYGGLDCSPCRDMLEKAAERSEKSLSWNMCWDGDGMPPDAVKVMHMFCDWGFNCKKDEKWAYWSAREFLRVCAENDLSIRFTY